VVIVGMVHPFDIENRTVQPRKDMQTARRFGSLKPVFGDSKSLLKI
jgi:hypothetical protein